VRDACRVRVVLLHLTGLARIIVTKGPAMQLWWSTKISSPSRTSVPATIGEPQRHHGADKGDSPAAARGPDQSLPIGARTPGGVGAGFQGDKPHALARRFGELLMVSVASRRVGSMPLPMAASGVRREKAQYSA